MVRFALLVLGLILALPRPAAAQDSYVVPRLEGPITPDGMSDEAAVEDGFVQAMPCVDPPGLGAIGIRYVKTDRFDTTIDLEKPEVLFYEPQKNGRLRLVGAEPVVPIAAWDETHDEPPSLFDREFHRNEDAGLYGLHMWVWLHNPEGIFAFTHPKVSCEFAV